MYYLGNMPLLRVLIPFTGGILVSIFVPVSLWLPCTFFLTGFLSVLIRFLIGKKFPRRLEWIAGAGFFLCFFSLGVIRVFFEKDFLFNHHYSRMGSITAVEGRLSDELHEKPRSYKTSLTVESVRDSAGHWHKSHGEMLFYMSKSPESKKLNYGDRVLIHAKPTWIAEPSNPDEFNYKRYLYFHNIYAQVYANQKSWILLEKSEPTLRGFALSLRQRLISTLEKYIIRKQEVSVAAALVLGFRDFLDIEQINAFSSAGAMHVLAVSGMHVGILFLMLGAVFGWIEKFRRIRWLKHLMILSFIWFYAMLTGFSPSVMRASVMISVMIIGQMISRKGNIYNTMALAATILISFKPFMITEVGFQLSFLAVFGIVAWHPVVFRWFEPSSWLLHKIWEITSVSLAAQIMTFPLGLLYFHQFPLLFFVSNLVVIPLAFVIMVSTIVLLLLSLFSGLGMLLHYAGIIVFSIIYVLNQSVLMIDKQATSVLKGITISVAETWLIYLIILLIFSFLVHKIPKFLIAALTVFILLLSYQVWEGYLQARQRYFVCYAVKNFSAYSFIEGRKHYFFADDSLRNNKSLMLFHILHHQWAKGMIQGFGFKPNENVTDGSLAKGASFASFMGKKFYFCNGFPDLKSDIPPLEVDYLILSKGAFMHVESLNRFIKAGTIVLDSSFPKWKAERLMNKLNGKVFSVNHSGAFIADLKP